MPTSTADNAQRVACSLNIFGELRLPAQPLQKLRTMKRACLKSSDELSCSDVVCVMICSQIAFLRCWSHMASVFQVSKHAVGNVVILLRACSMLDRFGKGFQVHGCLSQSKFPNRLALLDVAWTCQLEEK